MVMNMINNQFCNTKLLLNCYVPQCQTRSTNIFYTAQLQENNLFNKCSYK